METTAWDAKDFREFLKAGALNRAERDLRIAEEWFPLEEEAWELGGERQRSENSGNRSR